MQALSAGNVTAGNSTVYAPTDGLQPVYCLFTQPQYEGDKWCAMVGGGDVISGRKKMAQSVISHGGGWVEMFPVAYANTGGAGGGG